MVLSVRNAAFKPANPDKGDDNDSSSGVSEEDTWVSQNSTFMPHEAAMSIHRMSLETHVLVPQSIAANLPYELLLEIFKFLPSMKDLHSTLLTCQSWCACSVELLWYKPLLLTAPAMIRFLPIIRREGLTFDYPAFIRRLNLSYLSDQISDAILKKLQRCNRLERLTLVGCHRVTDRGLCDVLSKNTGIIALDVSGVEEISDLSVLVVASRHRNIQGLNLTDCKKITDEAIINVANKCPNLRRV